MIVPGRPPLPLHDPVPGGTGGEGSVWTRLAALPSFLERFGVLELALFAVGGTAVADWHAGGRIGRRLADHLLRLREGGFVPDAVLWHQGERDTLLGTGADAYERDFLSLWSLVTAIYPDATGLVSCCSWRDGHCSEAVRHAQQRLASGLPALRRGPDTDRLGSCFRSDNTHFSDAGLDAFAALILATLEEAAE